MALPLCGRRRFAPTGIFPMLQTLFEAIIPQRQNGLFSYKKNSKDQVYPHNGKNRFSYWPANTKSVTIHFGVAGCAAKIASRTACAESAFVKSETVPRASSPMATGAKAIPPAAMRPQPLNRQAHSICWPPGRPSQNSRLPQGPRGSKQAEPHAAGGKHADCSHPMRAAR